MLKHLESIEEFYSILSSKVNVLIDFYADWCGPCQLLTPVLEEIDEEYKDIYIVKVNADKFGDLCLKYNIYSIPALLLFQNGELKNQTVGYMPKSRVLKFIGK